MDLVANANIWFHLLRDNVNSYSELFVENHEFAIKYLSSLIKVSLLDSGWLMMRLESISLFGS
jgi:hypothetical protein